MEKDPPFRNREKMSLSIYSRDNRKKRIGLTRCRIGKIMHGVHFVRFSLFLSAHVHDWRSEQPCDTDGRYDRFSHFGGLRDYHRCFARDFPSLGSCLQDQERSRIRQLVEPDTIPGHDPGIFFAFRTIPDRMFALTISFFIMGHDFEKDATRIGYQYFTSRRFLPKLRKIYRVMYQCKLG